MSRLVFPSNGFYKILALALFFFPPPLGMEGEGESFTLLLEYSAHPYHTPIYVALKEGFFAEEGIEVYIKQYSEKIDPFSFLVTHQNTLVVTYFYRALRYLDRNTPLIWIASLVDHPLIGLLLTSPFPKIVGSPMGEFTSLLVKEMQNKQLFDEKRAVNWKKIDSDGTLLLASGNMGGMLGAFEAIEEEQLKSMGIATQWISLARELSIPSYPELVLIGNRNYFSSHCHLASSIRRALQKAQSFCQRDEERAFSHYRRWREGRERHWEKNSWKRIHSNLSVEEGDGPASVAFIDWLYQRGYLQQTPERLSALFFFDS